MTFFAVSWNALRSAAERPAAAAFQLDGLGPAPMLDQAGNTVPALGVIGRF